MTHSHAARLAACPRGSEQGARARTARLGPSGMRRHGDQRRQADVQLAEIAPALLLAVVAEQRAENEILLGAELADGPNGDPPRHGDELGIAEIEIDLQLVHRLPIIGNSVAIEAGLAPVGFGFVRRVPGSPPLPRDRVAP